MRSDGRLNRGVRRNFENRGCAVETWRKVWRDGFAKVLPIEGLKALAEALRTDDQRLTQGSTTTPPPLMCVQDWPVEAACALGLCGAAVHGGFKSTAEEFAASRGDVPHTNPDAALIVEVENEFARYCFDVDQLFGAPAECRWFLNWFDDTPRDEMRRELLPEVEAAIASRS